MATTPASVRDKRKTTRSHLAALFADIPRKRRAAAMLRAWKLFETQLEENELSDTKYDDKGRIVRFGTSAKDRATVTRETLQSMKLLAEIYRESAEHDAAMERLIAGIFGQVPQVPTIHIHYPEPSTAPVDPDPTSLTTPTDAPSADSSEPPASAGAPGHS